MEMDSPNSGTDSSGSGRSRRGPTDKLSAANAGASVSRGFPKVIIKENTLRGPEAGSPPVFCAAQTGSPPAAEYDSDVSEGMGTFGTEPEQYQGKLRRRIGSDRGTPIKGEGTLRKLSSAHVPIEWSEDDSSTDEGKDFKFWRHTAERPRDNDSPLKRPRTAVGGVTPPWGREVFPRP